MDASSFVCIKLSKVLLSQYVSWRRKQERQKLNENDRKPLYWTKEDRIKVSGLRNKENSEKKSENTRSPQRVNYRGKNIGAPVKVQQQMREKKQAAPVKVQQKTREKTQATPVKGQKETKEKNQGNQKQKKRN
jgi:hypothetical protein